MCVANCSIDLCTVDIVVYENTPTMGISEALPVWHFILIGVNYYGTTSNHVRFDLLFYLS